MADTRISGLTSGNPAQSGDEIPVARAGANYKITAGSIASLASGLTVNTTTITGGTSGRVLFDNAGTVGEKAVTGTGDVVLATSPTLTTPNLGTPSALTLTNATGLPVGGISATGTPSASNYLRGDGSWQAVTTSPAGSDTYIQFNDGGAFGADADLRFDKGNNELIVGNLVTSPYYAASQSFYFVSSSALRAATDGNLTLYNNATTDFGQLQFGGTTSSFPSLKRSGTDIQFRLANDSAYSAAAASALKIPGSTSGTVTLTAAATAGTWTLTLPTSAGTNGYVLQTDGSGNTSWVAQSGGGGSPAGSDKQVQFNDGGSFGAEAGFEYNKTTNTLSVEKAALGTAGSALGVLTLSGNTSGTVTIQTAAAAGTYTLTLPTDDGTSGQYLQTNGSGVLSWATVSGGGTPGGSSGQLQYNNAGAFDGSNLWQSTNTVEQRNGTNAQTLSVYATYTDASNYERTTISSATYSSALYHRIRAETAGTGGDNINLVLSPAGTGAFMLQMPDGTATGGNARGQNAIDLQLGRSAASQVASGQFSVGIGGYCTASGQDSVAIGAGATASASGAVALGASTSSGSKCFAGPGSSASGNWTFASGSSATSSSQAAIAIGQNVTASAFGSVAFGVNAKAAIAGQFSRAVQKFSADGDAQISDIVLFNSTTNATATELFVGGSSSVGSSRMVLPASTTWMADINVIARSSGGTDNACFKRRCIIKRDAANDTVLVGSVQTIDTDIGSNSGSPPTGWAVTITADNTNESLKIEVTGAAATNIRWVARVDLVEVGYA